MSHCKLELEIPSPKDLKIYSGDALPTPPLVVMSLSTKVVSRRPASEVVVVRYGPACVRACVRVLSVRRQAKPRTHTMVGRLV